MSERDAFGPNLRRLRMQRGVTIEHIAATTKVSAALWTGLEQNNLSRWPTGIYARAFVRDYARAIGVDAEATVDEFCRCFPHGDRRAEPVFREHADIVGHALEWQDHVPPVVADQDRRGLPLTMASSSYQPAGALTAFSQMFVRLRRAVGLV
jgi:transcriptional regulator with XRE-family HTH domain